MKNVNKLLKMIDVMHTTRTITLRPGNAIGNYETKCISLIVDDDFMKIFPRQVTDFTIINKTEYDVIKKYFPIPEEDSNGVKCLLPVEKHLAEGKLPPNPYIYMDFHNDPELFEKYTEGTDIHILGAQFRPVDNSYRDEFDMGGIKFIPLGIMDITCSWKYSKIPFTVSQFISMKKDIEAYEFRVVYKIDPLYQIMLVHYDFYFNSNNSDFNDNMYQLFNRVIPCVSRESMRLWDGIQYMMLHPKLKEVFFSEEGPAPVYARRPIRSGVDLRKARNNVRYVHIDISKHHTITEKNSIKRTYTRHTDHWPVKGYTRVKNGKLEYVGPSIRGPKRYEPLENPVERKLM